jgi:hypothetical protein
MLIKPFTVDSQLLIPRAQPKFLALTLWFDTHLLSDGSKVFSCEGQRPKAVPVGRGHLLVVCHVTRAETSKHVMQTARDLNGRGAKQRHAQRGTTVYVGRGSPDGRSDGAKLCSQGVHDEQADDSTEAVMAKGRQHRCSKRDRSSKATGTLDQVGKSPANQENFCDGVVPRKPLDPRHYPREALQIRGDKTSEAITLFSPLTAATKNVQSIASGIPMM